ncbi:TP53-target gene 5 protein [Paroedura picta]|uniref:TP53-target gene 5 protein n=1 Tax=Paroedura picta TaxID=143630 RepID=UPI0040572C44
MKTFEKRKDPLMSKTMESGASQTSNIRHVKRQLNRILKKLVILKLLKGPNRRIKWLHELAYKYRKTLAFRDPLVCLTAPSAPGTSMTLEDPLMPSAEMVVDPVAEPSENMVDQNHEAEPSSEASTEPQSPDLYQVLSLQGLPQRLHMPAPRVLCRPSALRWTKPCCTRSCYETLDHVVTFPYSRR